MKSKPVKGFFVKMNKNETQFIESEKGNCIRYEYDDGSTVFLKKPIFETTTPESYKGNPEPIYPRYVGGIDPYTHPDTERLNKLEKISKGNKLGWLLTDTILSGNGITLYETNEDWAYPTVREAIDAFDEREKTDKDT